jgi:hypothetical protein
MRIVDRGAEQPQSDARSCVETIVQVITPGGGVYKSMVGRLRSETSRRRSGDGGSGGASAGEGAAARDPPASAGAAVGEAGSGTVAVALGGAPVGGAVGGFGSGPVCAFATAGTDEAAMMKPKQIENGLMTLLC